MPKENLDHGRILHTTYVNYHIIIYIGSTDGTSFPISISTTIPAESTCPLRSGWYNWSPGTASGPWTAGSAVLSAWSWLSLLWTSCRSTEYPMDVAEIVCQWGFQVFFRTVSFNGLFLVFILGDLNVVRPTNYWQSFYEATQFLKCNLILTRHGLNGGSNCLDSSACQSMGLKKGWSWMSPVEANLLPNRLFQSFSKNCNLATKLKVVGLHWRVLLVPLLRHRVRPWTRTWESPVFRCRSTKTVRLRRSRWMATVQLAFRIVALQTTTNRHIGCSVVLWLSENTAVNTLFYNLNSKTYFRGHIIWGTTKCVGHSVQEDL